MADFGIGVSVLVLTKNEEQDLPGCLETISWSDDVHVYDSNSTDATVDIALKYGAKVTKREFDNWASHQNWALKNISFKYPWVFYIDADERMTPDLISSICSLAAEKSEHVAFRVRRRDFFMSTWLRHVQTSPYFIRLFRPEKMHYERLVNPISVPHGSVGDLNGYLDHFPFSKGLAHWISRHNSYSTFEATQIIDGCRERQKFSIFKALFESDFHVRRYNQKELFYKMPFRPLIKFIILYFFKRGFMDGRAGFTYAVLQSIYEYFIVLKVRESMAISNSIGPHDP